VTDLEIHGYWTLAEPMLLTLSVFVLADADGWKASLLEVTECQLAIRKWANVLCHHARFSACFTHPHACPVVFCGIADVFNHRS
jgi:hypothetical protein